MRWASFDCYGTLIDWEHGIASALTRLLPGHDPADLLARYHRLEPELQAGGARSYRAVLADAARAVAGEVGVTLDPNAARALPDSLPDWAPFAEVPGELAALRDAGWRIAILSNTDPDLLAASIARIGVEPDLTITVAEAGSYKPAAGPWEAFAERARPTEHVHVAASLFHDIEPCARLDVRAVWINRLGEASDLPRAAELPTLAGLTGVLAGL